MKYSILLIILILLSANMSFSQSSVPFEQDVITPTYVEPNYPTSPLDHCFDVDHVQDNCIPVYVNVNVHFFLDNNCEGNLSTAPGVIANLNPSNAFQLAETMVNDANNFFETMSGNAQGLNYQWNSEAHGANTTESQCIPIRYVLKGTQIHCNTNAQNTNTSFNDFNNFFTKSDSEINIFVSNVTGTAGGFSSLNYFGLVAENFNPAIFNHEIGHALNLNHTFSSFGDDCDDTWQYNWSWDSNCDGTPDEGGYNCWNSDPIVNNLNACNLANFCSAHPCCEWSAQNNNLMAYSAWAGNPDYSALTPCQINRMLKNLAEYKCKFIKVGGCPPPSAFVGTIPLSLNNTKCESCFYLNASFNESGYTLDILRPNGTKIISTGEVFSEASKFCIYPKYDKWGNPTWPNGFQSGVTYKMKLKVFNECGDENETEVSFVLPPLCNRVITDPVPHDPKKIVIDGISPNPTYNYINIKYSVITGGVLKIYGNNLTTLAQYGLIRNSTEVVGDNQQITLDLSQWQSGLNSLIFEYDGEVIIENLVKN